LALRLGRTSRGHRRASLGRSLATTLLGRGRSDGRALSTGALLDRTLALRLSPTSSNRNHRGDSTTGGAAGDPRLLATLSGSRRRSTTLRGRDRGPTLGGPHRGSRASGTGRSSRGL